MLVFRDTSQGFTQLIPGVDRILPLQEGGALRGNRCSSPNKTKFDLSAMTDVDSILNYTRSEEEDYYAILGCDETATVSVKIFNTSSATFVFFVCFFFLFNVPYCCGLKPPPAFMCNHLCSTKVFRSKLPHEPRHKIIYVWKCEIHYFGPCRLSCNYNAQFYLQAEQITAEYKVQALQFHPDKNAGNKEAEEKFQKLKVRTLTHIIRNVSALLWHTLNAYLWHYIRFGYIEVPFHMFISGSQRDAM